MAKLNNLFGRCAYFVTVRSGALLAAALLSGCVTMQGPQGSMGPSISKPFGVDVSEITDIFSTQLRELKALVTASKFAEAEQYYLDNADYFEKRYPQGAPLSEELKSLSLHVWSNKYEPKVKASIEGLSAVKAVPEISKWSSLSRQLEEARSLVKKIREDRLLRLAMLGGAEAKNLHDEYNRVLVIVASEKSNVVQALVASTLETGSHPRQYIANAVIDHSDFRASPEFQQAAVTQILRLANPEAVNAEARKLADYLSKNSKESIDRHYAKIIRASMNADGKITLEEIASLGKLNTPFGTGNDELKSVARVGYVDLTSASFKTRNIFDFEIAFDKDIEVEFIPATEATFSGGLDGYDFIFVTDLTVAKVAREFKSKEEIKSRYKSGVRPTPNPNYVTAVAEYQKAMAEFQRAQINSAIPKACQGWGCVFQGIADGIGSAAARKAVDEASQRLANTPQNLSIDVFSEYSYQSVSIKSSKTAAVNYYVIDVKNKRILKNDFSVSDQEMFTVAYNVRDDDPESSAISRRYMTEEAVTSWEKRAVRIPLSRLFGSDGLKSASVEPFKGVQAFLSTLSTRVYASATPTYAAASSPMAPIRSSSTSSETIADERFDSIVIVRNAQSVGTGFYVTPELILTAYHVVDGGALVELTFYDGTKTYGRVVDHDVRLDLALIRPQTAGKPLKIHSGPLRLGETVEAIGHPRGYEFTITRGVISSVRKQRSATISSDNLVEFVQTDTPISPGNSGGPLLLRDAVIGVNDWIRLDKGSQNLNFSVSFNEIRAYLERFKGGVR